MKIIAENVDVSFDRDMQMLLTFKISPESRSAAMQGFNELTRSISRQTSTRSKER